MPMFPRISGRKKYKILHNGTVSNGAILCHKIWRSYLDPLEELCYTKQNITFHPEAENEAAEKGMDLPVHRGHRHDLRAELQPVYLPQ
jgi:hypothetical protein